MKLKQLEKRHADLLAKGRAAYKAAEDEGREFSESEWAELKSLDAEVAELNVEIQKGEADAALAAQIRQRFGGAAEPVQPAQPLQTGGMRAMSLGQFFTNAPEYMNWMKQIAPSGHVPQTARGLISPPVQVKSIPGLFGRKELVTGASATSAGAFVEPDYTGIYEPIGRYALTVLGLLSRRTTGSDLVSFVQQTHQITQAAAVQEANVTDYAGGTGEISGEKPEATIRFVEVQIPVTTIAAWIPMTKNALADAPQVQGIVNQELRDDLQEELETQVINGTGLGANLTGILATAGILAQAWNTDIVVTARQAITTLMVTGRSVPTGIAMNPADWETVDLMTDLNGQYMFGGPLRMGVRTLWGVPVAQCMSLAVGQAILGDWRKAVLWDREQTTIQVSDSHADFFIRNMVAILAEMRAAFGLISPDSFIVLDLTAGS